MDGQIRLNLGWEVPYPEGISTAKVVNFCPANIKLGMHERGVFLVLVKYTLAYTGCTWLHNTLSCVLIVDKCQVQVYDYILNLSGFMYKQFTMHCFF